MRARTVTGLLCAIPALVFSVAALAADPPPVEAYGRLPFLRDVRMSPDGTMVAAIVPSPDGQESLVVQHLNSKAPTVIPVEGYLPDWFKWKNNQRLIVSIHRTARARSLDVLDIETRMVAVNADGSNSVEIGRGRERRFVPVGHRQLEDALVDLLPDDPKHILLALGGHDGVNVEKVDIDTGVGDVVEYGKHDIGYWVTDRTGAARAGSGIYETDVYTYVRPAGSMDWTEINRQDANFGAPIRPIAFAADPDTLYVDAPSSSGLWGVVEYDTTKKTLGRVVASRPDRDIDYIERDNLLAGYIAPGDRAGVEKAVYLDPVWEHDVESIDRALPDTLNLILDRTADGKRLLVFARGPQEPGAYYVLDRNGAKPTMDLLGDRYPDVFPEQVAPPKAITYTARDGTVIHGYVLSPKGATGKPIPFVVLPHGGPDAHDNGYFDYLAQFLVSRGYGVFQPNFRGSTGYGVSLRHGGVQQWGLAIQDDVTDGTKWLIDQKLADPKRIAIMGGGFGGYTALMGAAKESDLYRCVASLGGITDLPAYAFFKRHFGGHRITIAEFDNGKLSDLSPVNHADQIKVPVLLVHGRLDWQVPVEQSLSMESALKSANKAVTSLYFENDDGGIVVRSRGEVDTAFDFNDSQLATGPSRLAFLQAVEKFLKDNLGPGAS